MKKKIVITVGLFVSLTVRLVFALMFGLFVSLMAGLITSETAIAADGAQNNPGETLPSSASDIRPLMIGSDIPEVMLQDVNGESVMLQELHRDKPVMIIFYRGGWCPFCNRHLAELSTMEEAVHELGMEIIAISPDSPEQLNEGLDGHEPSYTLLSDEDRTAARHFGIAFQVMDPEQVAALTERTGHSATADGRYIFPVPAVFILDAGKVVRFQYVDPDYRRRINGAILMAAAEYVAGL